MERPSFGKTTVVGDMHTRKRLMAKESNAFIALPGGFGTMEELMEVMLLIQISLMMPGGDLVTTWDSLLSDYLVQCQRFLYAPSSMD
jgi:uncharacterized protein (TIGR00730 family)